MRVDGPWREIPIKTSTLWAMLIAISIGYPVGCALVGAWIQKIWHIL